MGIFSDRQQAIAQRITALIRCRTLLENGSRLASYAGLAPVNRRSGKSINRHPSGKHRLKDAMFTAAFVAAYHDPTAKTYYQRKRTEGKHHNAAVICVAHRRCDLILAMLTNQTPYNPQHPNTPTPQHPNTDLTKTLPRHRRHLFGRGGPNPGEGSAKLRPPDRRPGRAPARAEVVCDYGQCVPENRTESMPCGCVSSRLARGLHVPPVPLRGLARYLRNRL